MFLFFQNKAKSTNSTFLSQPLLPILDMFDKLTKNDQIHKQLIIHILGGFFFENNVFKINPIFTRTLLLPTLLVPNLNDTKRTFPA